MNAPAISFDSVCFSYEATEVLHDVSFEIMPCDLVAMVGPNGGGKTTLLRLILGLQTPLRGSIRVLGKEPKEVRPRIGYVAQHFDFDPKYPVSVLDVVLMGQLGPSRGGPYGKSSRAGALEALERVGMTSCARRSLTELSGGQRQRVFIAQALCTEPEILLLDEPTASVDVNAENSLYELFRALNEDLTIVMSSHNLGVVTRYVNRVLCVNRQVDSHLAEELIIGHLDQPHLPELAVLHHAANCPVVDPGPVHHHHDEDNKDSGGEHS